MRLENLYPNFTTSPPPLQLKYITEYRLRRAEDMSKQATWPKIKAKGKGRKKQPPLTGEEKTLMNLLGLKKKDIIDMRGGLK